MEYSPPSTAAGLNADEEMMRLIAHMQSARAAHQLEKQVEAKERAEARKKEAFQKKQREGKFLLDPRKREPWKLGDQHMAVNFETDAKPLPAGDIHPLTLYRTKHFIPRTFQEAPQPFVSTTQNGQFFHAGPPTKLLSKSAQAVVEKRKADFEAEVERRRKQEMKRKQVVFANRWEPSGAGSRNFSTPPSDQYYLFERQLKDRPLQDKPFLRAKRDGELFS